MLGEYNKSSASPELRIEEVLAETAFKNHTYSHTTLGYLADIKDMPNQIAYSKEFFNRFYRPEYTTIVVVGDVQIEPVRALVKKYWSTWKRGSYQSTIPVEPPQESPRAAHIQWATPTLPYSVMAFRVPEYTDTEKDSAALDLIAALGFSENSPLFKTLVLDRQQVDSLQASYSNHVDPYLFTIVSRVKKDEDLPAVEEAVLSTLANFKDSPVAPERLNRVRRNLRYSMALALDNSEAIARTVASAVAMRRTPETLNRTAAMYDSLTPQDLLEVARKYFVEKNRTVVTLTGASK